MAVVLEVVNGAASQHDVCQDVAPKAVEHGAEPRGHGAAAGDLHRACGAQWGEGPGEDMITTHVDGESRSAKCHSSIGRTFRDGPALILPPISAFYE